jgi:hypothetical protein
MKNYKIPMNNLNISKSIRESKYVVIFVVMIAIISWLLLPYFERSALEIYLCFIRQGAFGYWLLYCWLNYKEHLKSKYKEKINFKTMKLFTRENVLLFVLFPLILMADLFILSLWFLIPAGMMFSFVSVFWVFYFIGKSYFVVPW